MQHSCLHTADTPYNLLLRLGCQSRLQSLVCCTLHTSTYSQHFKSASLKSTMPNKTTNQDKAKAKTMVSHTCSMTASSNCNHQAVVGGKQPVASVMCYVHLTMISTLSSAQEAQNGWLVQFVFPAHCFRVHCTIKEAHKVKTHQTTHIDTKLKCWVMQAV